MIPSSFVYMILRTAFLFLTGPGFDLNLWQILRYISGFDAGLDINVPPVDQGVPNIMAHGMYAVFYFTYSRSLGHMLVNAHIVHHRTGRRMRTWQKAVRSLLQIANVSAFYFLGQGYFLIPYTLDILSIVTVLIDRSRRRSVYDHIARTVVVVGEPTEEEPAQAKERNWATILGRLVGQPGATERG